MTEQLISFETAKLAREKGFVNPFCNNWYLVYPNEKPYTVDYEIRLNRIREDIGDDDIAAPTQSLLQKWLREKYLIHVWPKYISYDSKPWAINIDSLSSKDNGMKMLIIPLRFQSYEESLEIGLQEAIKLI